MSPIGEENVVGSSIERSFTNDDDHKLYEVNHDIKSTLTELLNCEAVRQDSKMRLWVQTRLMDAELELKRQRKRRLSVPSIIVSPSDDERRVSV